MDLSTIQKPIILEGPDGGGKSTLASSVFPNTIKHVMPTTQNEMTVQLYSLEPGRVYDRWVGISELIYAIFTRGDYLVPLEEIHAAIRYHAPIVIYCRPSNAVLALALREQMEKPHKDRTFIKLVTKHSAAIWARYDEIFEYVLPGLGCTVFHYDYTKHADARVLPAWAQQLADDCSDEESAALNLKLGPPP